MQRFLTARFEVDRLLRRSHHVTTFLGQDRWSSQKVFVKCLANRLHTNPPSFEDQLAWYHGMTHPLIGGIRHAGFTTRGDFYFVRDWYGKSAAIGGGLEETNKFAAQLVAATALL